MRPYISYDRTSVQLHVKKAGEAETVYDYTKLTISWANGNDDYQENWTDTNSNPTRFKVSKLNGSPITIYPGDSYYVTYKITVKPEVYAAMQSDKVTITNRYLAYVDNEKGGQEINRVWQQLELNEYSWVQKTQPDVTDQSETISMENQEGTSNIYVYDSSGTITQGSTETEFIVPEGCYQYMVKVNQTQGQFDVTGATLTDSLDKDAMKYVGYVKITAYDTSNKAAGTKWVKIDDQTSFSLKLSQLGWKNNNYSYQFEYYAKPVDLSTIGETKVTNTFKLTDEVKKYGSDEKFTFDNVNSSVEVILQGNYHLNAAKKAWYYEEPEENATTWQNGKLYWIIEVNGSAIKKDTEIKDAISWDNGLTDSFIHKNEASIAGIYKGDLGEIKGYSSFEEFETQNANSSKQDISSLFELKYQQDKSGFSGDNYNNLIFKAKEDITLGDGQTLYIIVRTEPQSLPDQYRKPYTYRNEIYKTEPGETQTKIGSADQKLYHGGEILKELGQVFTYDGKNVTTDSSIDGADKGDSGKICSDLLKDTGSGIYAAWAFKVNHGGELNSNYRVLEEIPEGMELAYIRIKWKGANATNVESSEIADLGSEWTKVENNSTNDDKQSQSTIYYVRNDKKQALIQLGRFQADHIEDQGSVDVQVVCRVTDPNVLLGGEEKTFTNKVILQSEDGRKDLATAMADAKIKDMNLTKENGYSTTSSNESQKVTYTIVANSRGQKLLTAEGEKLILVDTLGEYLSFDSESLKATNIKTKEQVEIQSSYNPKDKTIEIVIPDETPVEITYSVTVNIAPNKKVPLQNSVHWKSYSAKGGTTNKIEQFSYQLSVGGSSGTTSHPNLTIRKIDQDNTSNKMNGVEFEVYECEMKNGQIQHKDNAKNVKAIIQDGTCVINTNQFTMDFNTIYEVKETKAATATIEEKNGVPSVKKEVQEDSKGDQNSAWGNENTADIGQKVNFKTTITAKKGAENYVLHDTMSDGLTFDANSVNVKLKKKNDGSEETLKAAQYALVKPGTETEGTKCTFEVKFEKALCDTLENDDQLIVTYSATLNDKAEIGNTGNKNETKLTYGDNNKTETATTTTRTFEIPVFKYTLKDNKETALKDATFTLSKDSVTTPNTKEIIKLRKKNGTAEEEYLVDSNGEEQVTTTATGKFKIQGLDAGTYYLTETQQPAGYNKLKAPITIKIDDEGKIYVNEAEEVNVGDVKVLNNTGSLLPSTGGMGTTLFYIFGAILVIGSGVVLITKKRMK